MTRSIWLACGLVLSGATGALAQGACPTGIARDGIWLEFPDRSVLSRVLSDGRVQEMEFAHDGSYIFTSVSLPIGLLVDGWELRNGFVPRGDRETVRYVGTPDPVPAPAPGVRFDGLQISRFAEGGGETGSSVNLVVGAAQDIVIGGCRYTGLPVEVTRVDLSGGVFHESMMHMPDLGLTIYIAFSEGNAPRPGHLPIAISYDPPVAGGVLPAQMAPARTK
jgi:hypothetical protein